VGSDLLLQLGILSSKLGRFEAALGYLSGWHKINEQQPQAGRIYYHLGRSYHGLGDNKQAMVALQRSLLYDQSDDRAMNLLARIYLAENQGNDIALSLCRKSVELNPAKLEYKLYLAEILIACGLSAEARQYLYRCLKNRNCRPRAQLLLGRSYRLAGQSKRAVKWYQKIIKDACADKQIILTAKSELRQCRA
jgi:tetratricopeptide (TPR) repeat protein